jgi:hypothetical protein
MKEYTQTPWRTDEKWHDEPFQPIKISGPEGSIGTICTVWMDDAPVLDFNYEQRKNARHIIKCVNNYDILIEALTACIEQLEDEDPASRCMDNNAADYGRRALIKLDKES